MTSLQNPMNGRTAKLPLRCKLSINHRKKLQHDVVYTCYICIQHSPSKKFNHYGTVAKYSEYTVLYALPYIVETLAITALLVEIASGWHRT